MCDRDDFVTNSAIRHKISLHLRNSSITEASPIDFPLYGHVTLVQKRYVKLDNGVASDQQLMLRQLYLHYNTHQTAYQTYNMRI